jgi:hypothetical protein
MIKIDKVCFRTKIILITKKKYIHKNNTNIEYKEKIYTKEEYSTMAVGKF